MSFRITGLPVAEFADLFSLSDEALRARRAVRRDRRRKVRFPAEISLTDAELGEDVVLVHYEHQRADSPYRVEPCDYARQAEATYDAVDAVPDQLRRRMLSLRAFDESGMIVAADLVEGRRSKERSPRCSPTPESPISMSISPSTAATPRASSAPEPSAPPRALGTRAIVGDSAPGRRLSCVGDSAIATLADDPRR